MITPSFSLTATERVLPKLALDFTTASLDGRVTFTRTGNTATVVNSSGNVVGINADLPRFDYTLNTGGACKGLLIEESRTNLLLNSSGFDTGSWAYDAGIVVTANTTISPDGTQNADTIVYPSSNKSFAQFPTVTGLTISASIYLKGTAGETILLGCGGTQSLVTLSASWTRYTVPNIVYASGAPIQLSTYGGATARTVYAWGAQLEAGAFATSYIPTVASQVTRNADVAVMTETNFSSWFNASEGSLYVKADSYATNQSPARQTVFIAKTGTGSIQMKITRPSTLTGFSIVDDVGAVACDLSGSVLTNNTFSSVVGSYKTNSFAFADRGAATSTDVSGNVPTGLTNLYFGYDNSATYQNGHIAKFMYWPQQLTSAEVQAFSKG